MQDLSVHGISTFLQMLAVEVCDVGDVLLQAGSWTDEFFILRNGEVQVEVPLPDMTSSMLTVRDLLKQMDVKKEELPLNLWGREVMTKDIIGWPGFAKNTDYSCTISVDGKVIKKLYPVPDEYTFAVSSEGDAQSFETTM